MFIEALLTREELRAFVGEALPLTIRLGDADSEHSLVLHDLADVRLVPDLGLEVTCQARVHWPLLGVEVPIVLRSLRVLLTPSMRPGPTCDVLVFRLSLEHTGVSGIPDVIDEKVAHAINRKLAEHRAELAWDFSTLFGHKFALPETLEPLEAALMRAAWGKLKITEDAFVAAVSVHTVILRRDSPAPLEFARVLVASPRAAASASAGSDVRPVHFASRALAFIAAGVFGLAIGAAYFGARSAR